MTPQQINQLEKQLQRNHVDIQRLWKAAFQFPEPYVGMPMAAQPGGLTTDTTQTTHTTTVTTTTRTTQTLPPGPCHPYVIGTYQVEAFNFTQNDPANEWCSPALADHGCGAMSSASAVVGIYMPNAGNAIGRDACQTGYEYFVSGYGDGNPPFIGPNYGDCGVYIVLRYALSPYSAGSGNPAPIITCYYATFDSLAIGASALAGRYGGSGDPFDECFTDPTRYPCKPADFLVITRLT